MIRSESEKKINANSNKIFHVHCILCNILQNGMLKTIS